MAFWRQFRQLMWKHFLQHWRRKWATGFQLLIPLLFAIIFMALRFIVTAEQPLEFGNGQYTVYGRHVWYLRNTVVYTPNNTLINNLMRDISNRISGVQFIGFRSSVDMLAYYRKHSEDIPNAIEFMGLQIQDTALPKNLYFTIRPRIDKYNDDWRTYTVHPSFNQWLPRRGIFLWPNYKGFLHLQRLVSDAVIRYWRPQTDTFLNGLNVNLERMPYPSYVRDRMIRVIQDFFPVLLMLSFLFIAVQTTKDIVDEKEKRLKESMKVMGLSSAAYWTSWFLFRFLQLTIIMVFFAIFCCVDFSGKGAPFPKSDPSLFFIFLEFYGVAIISYSFMISVFMQKASNAAAMSGVLFFFCYLPYFYISYAIRFLGVTTEGHQGFCVLFNLGMAYGAHLIALYEGFGTGVQWSNFDKSPTAHDNFALLHAMLMLLLDTVIYLTITWYVDNVWPGEYGVPKPWYFPFTWCRRTRHSGQGSGNTQHGISIQNLEKVFQTCGSKTEAVKNVTLDVRNDEITVLIGPNGSGKTTTVSILAGLTTASGGTAIVNGYNISTDIEKVRESLSLCPQHDVLFDTMTVKEHLKFFACLKGVSRKEEMDEMIKKVGLSSQEGTQSRHLSGGQRRKLSFGIALLGDTKIVVFNEPTSGIDPQSRLEAWNILKQKCQGRTILLTTQCMDEAQYLGHHITIMRKGSIERFDTPHNLNSHYRGGYQLVIEKEATCEAKSVTAEVQALIPSAIMESETTVKLSYLLPIDHSNRFAAIFSEIERQKTDLGIASISMKTMDMEEVFKKAIKQNDFSDIKNLQIDKLNGWCLKWSRIKALLVKKFLHIWRNKPITCVQLLLPLALIGCGLAVTKSSKTTEMALTLDLSPFRGSYVPYWKGDESNPLSASFAKAYIQQFAGTGNDIEDTGNISNVTHYFLRRAQQLGLDNYNKKMVIGAKFTSFRSITAFYNRQPYHAEPISLSYIMNGFLKDFTSEEYSITTIINPLPPELLFSYYDSWMGPVTGIMISFCVVFGITCITAPFVYPLIMEREVGAKHLQLISGVRPLVFWASTFAWDFLYYIISVVILLLLFLACQVLSFITDERLAIVFLILLLYGLDVLSLVYTLQYIFKSAASGMVIIIIASVLTGMGTLLLVRILVVLDLQELADKCDLVFSIVFSHYNFGRCFENLYVNYISTQYCMERNFTAHCDQLNPDNIPWYVLPCCKGKCGEYCVPFVNNVWAWESPGLARSITFMIIQAVVFMVISICIEIHVPQRVRYKLSCLRVIHQRQAEDDDVANERKRVEDIQTGQSGSDLLVLKGLSKCHGNFVAVDDINLGISKGECFGLIGQNGAGKTSTFKMLTGDMLITDGNACLGQHDIKNNTRKFLESIGYCPQFDAHIDHMTGREILTMYARLRGVPKDRISDVCDNLLDALHLQNYADKRALHYSGGNRRKLSTAVALVGNPEVILLDEPSTGMDPNVRIQLWNVLEQVRSWGRTILLTSHSMEECEALCTRLAIMVNNHVVCLGTPQHLKTKYGKGYTITARMSTNWKPDVESLIDFIKMFCNDLQVQHTENDYVSLLVPDSSFNMSVFFTIMEDARVQMLVEDYSIQHTTLEQVFLDQTKNQVSTRLSRHGKCSRICCHLDRGEQNYHVH